MYMHMDLEYKWTQGNENSLSVMFDSLWCQECNPPGSSVLHYVLKFAQIHIHQDGDVIQPSHPLSSASPPTFNLSQHQGLFQWVSSAHQVAKVLEFQLQHQSFQTVFRVDFLYDWPVGSLCNPRDTLESSPGAQFNVVQLSYPYMTIRKTIALTRQTFVGKVMSLLFNVLSRFVIAFLPRSKHLYFHGCSHCLQWFWSPRK